MNEGQNHIPFRASKLTLALRDGFISKKFKSRVVVIACVCPGSRSADHSVNTLRYADRLKSKKSTKNYDYPQEDIKSNINLVEKEKLPFDKKLEGYNKKKLLKKVNSKAHLKSQSKKKNKGSELGKLFPKDSPSKLFPKMHSDENTAHQPTPNAQPPVPIEKHNHKQIYSQ